MQRVSNPAVLLPVLAMLSAALPAQEPKLEYRARQAVERQERNLAELKKRAAPFADFATTLADPKAARVAWGAEMKECVSKAEAILQDLEKSGCPADHPRVKALVEAVAAVRASLEAARPALEERAAAAAQAADVSNYPDFRADCERLETIEKSYGLSLHPQHAPKIAEVMAEDARVRSWIQDRAGHYRPLIASQNQAGNLVRSRLESAGRAIKKFTGEAQKFLDGSKERIEQALANAEKMAAEAQARKNPAFFTGGVRQALEQAEATVELFQALAGAGHETTKKLQTRVGAVRESVAAAADSMKAELLAAARPPEDAYVGDDRPELESLVRETWKKQWPDDKLLKVVFHMKEWDRSQKMKWREGEQAWEKVDMSVLCVTMIVQTGAETATTYPCYVNRDNVAGKTTIGADTKGSGYVQNELMLKNL